jgi:DNA-binding response OmpR family regulator
VANAALCARLSLVRINERTILRKVADGEIPTPNLDHVDNRGESFSILLVEDDVRLAQFTTDYLARYGWLVTHVTNGVRALQETAKQRFDAVVLDVMLPGRDGLSVCQKLREESDVPIVMVTARQAEVDRVVGFELGADDYVVKPFSPRELIARLRAIIRRDRGLLGPSTREVRVGTLRIATDSRSVWLHEAPISFTTAEFDLLLALARRPGRVLSRTQILDLAKGNADEVFERGIDVLVFRVRSKLSAAHPTGTELIRTVRGVGYMLAESSG